ncbi:Bug family tripartite tricarboxylate transporter substrate binding protein [Ramlibacter rhizophilus]|uniref:Tripartite tricarboxylate transporter substrate binding protein n=1 Tax=Ramlibacter rhizophilus TaxID=1781167 RepID=A0A4Z0BZT1_9BURK|nr:tripartite tricarboxylate transporter substrate binding protein [Ramlibacter rhizophilus]TFZ04806.1 tripartite tricarboxylate transporter substrate binding protein [Ramlibacter rhizophilus]
MNSPTFRRRVLTRGLLAACAGLIATTGVQGVAFAQGQDWPSKPIRVVVNFPPGSSPDLLARAIATPLHQALGQPVVVENKAGASGIIGADQVAKATADGHTLLMTAGSVITNNPHLFEKLPYDTAKDLVPVAPAARMTLFLVSRGNLPAGDVKEFLQWVKANPGKVSYGSAGNGTGLHIAGEMLKTQAGVKAVHVPYKGASPALQDLLAGQIDYYFDPGIALPHVKAGKLKMLATASPKRSPHYPDVPTLHEVGLKGFDAGTTHGFYAPAGTPAPVVERLNREINRIVATSPEVQAQMANMAAEATPMSPKEFDAVMQDDSRRYAEIIKSQGIRAQ